MITLFEHKFKITAITVIAFFFISNIGLTQVNSLYGLINERLVRVDSSNANISLIHNFSSVNYNLARLTYSNDANCFYTIDNSSSGYNLYKLTLNGTITLIGSITNGTIQPGAIEGLYYNNVDHNLYASASLSGNSWYSEEVINIDTSNGQFSNVQTIPLYGTVPASQADLDKFTVINTTLYFFDGVPNNSTTFYELGFNSAGFTSTPNQILSQTYAPIQDITNFNGNIWLYYSNSLRKLDLNSNSISTIGSSSTINFGAGLINGLAYAPSCELDLGNDTSLCYQQSFTISLSTLWDSILWNDNSNTPNYSVDNNDSLVYATTVDSLGCVASDSLIIYPIIDTLSLGNDTIICPNSPYSITISGNINNASYSWNNGDTLPHINVNSPGVYSLMVTDINGCVFNDSISVSEFPYSLDLGPDTSACINSNFALSLNTNVPASSYLWNTNASTPSIFITNAGLYSLTITDTNQCTQTDTIHVIGLPVPQISISGPDTICYRDTLELMATGDTQFGVNWNNGSVDSSLLVTSPSTGWYSVSVSNSFGCDADDSLYLFVNSQQTIELGNDTGICPNNSGYISIGTNSVGSYQWNTGDTAAYIQTNAPGQYILTVQKDGCEIIDTVNILAYPAPNPSLPDDTLICDTTTSFHLTPGTFQNYVWSTGEITPIINVSFSNHYYVTVTNNFGCENDDSTKVTFYSPPEITISDTSICETQIPFTLYTMDLLNDSNYSLSENGTEIEYLEIHQFGSYPVTLIDSSTGCKSVHTISFNPISYTPPIYPEDLLLCPTQGSLEITPINTPYNLQFLWDNGDTENSTLISEIGEYTVSYFNSCIIDSVIINVTMGGCPLIFIPNAFTPNSDNLNNTWRPVISEEIGRYHLMIYNRWGQLIFESFDQSKAWDGTFHGSECSQAKYAYKLSYVLISGQTKEKTGSIFLVR